MSREKPSTGKIEALGLTMACLACVLWLLPAASFADEEPAMNMEFGNVKAGTVLEAIGRQAGKQVLIGIEFSDALDFRIDFSSNQVPLSACLEKVLALVQEQWTKESTRYDKTIEPQYLPKIQCEILADRIIITGFSDAELQRQKKTP